MDPKHLYESLKNGDKSEKMMEAYANAMCDEKMIIPTVHNDTILHLAIYMGQEYIAKEIVSRCCKVDDRTKQRLKETNDFGNTVLHEAVAAPEDMLSLVKQLLSAEPALLSIPNKQKEMPIYTAAHYGKTDTFKYLADKLGEKKIENKEVLHDHLRPFRENLEKTTTVFHAAIHAEFFELALVIAELYPSLIREVDKDGMTGLQLLSSNSSAFESGTKRGLIRSLIYSCAPYETDRVEKSVQKDSALVNSSVNKSVWSILIKWDKMEEIYKEKKGHKSALKLAEYLIPGDLSWEKIGVTYQNPNRPAPQDPVSFVDDINDASGGSDSDGHDKNDKIGHCGPEPDTPLLLATSHGIEEIVDEILRVFPAAIEHVSRHGKNNILHVAVKHRQQHIFDTITQMELPKSRLTRRINKRGFTILHQVGNMKYHRGTLAGPALQLQEELQWFEKVKRIVPAHFTMQLAATDDKKEKDNVEEKEKRKETDDKKGKDNLQNKRMETPWDYFRRTHGELLREAQEWLERTAQSCSTVAGLIATVAFAAAFTVPGGNDDEGHPLLINSPFFLVFIITDALSLASSLTSLVMFLSILTSPFELQDFHHTLPRMLIFGFTFLFFSVAVTMLAFASTLMLVISTNKRLTTYLVYCIAFLPVSMFAILQFPIDRTTAKKFLNAIKRLNPWPLISNVFPKHKTE